ncbi:MAG: toll/interleukin-1 receptor domain-containing protein [Burkholderiales bacterium]|nr:toll/interleukin-1 receptor domain-containing protein [Burkholderiales bacterium]
MFLSYPRKDLEPVRALVSALKAEGLTVWLDESNIEAFERIHDHVAQGIADSRALAWYSLNYAASRPCQSELSAAYLCEAGDRVLVVNPESDHGHIQPRALVNRLYGEAKDAPGIARRVKGCVSRFAFSIGDGVSFTQPLHYGRQLAGSNRFVGRTPILWKTHDALEKSGAAMLTGTRRSVVQLRGFGGVGKSLLAEEYALRFGAAYPGGIFWLKAYGNDDDQGINQTRDREGERCRQISEFASQLRVPTEGRPPAEIRAALGQILAAGRRSLWIVDDLPSALNSEVIEEWLSPHASVPTLITTRDRSHSSLGELVDVDVLSNEESFALLEFHRTVDDVEQNVARDLLNALGHHALAVEIAASYLGDQKSISIDEFLNELRNPREDVLEEAAALADALPIGHSPSIVATLNTTISQLSEPARDLLCLASCLASAPIPKELIEAVFMRLSTPDPPGLARKKAVKETERFALSRKESMPADAVSVHTLVARTARRRAGSQDRIARIHAAGVGSLIDTLYGIASLGSILRRSLEITHARAVSDPLATPDEATLLVLVANADLNRGDLESADRLARRALQYCTAKLGENSLETCFAKSGIAMVMLTQRNYADAHQILVTGRKR